MSNGIPKPRYQAIAEDLRNQIRGGILRPGQTLPSYRMLMKQHSVTVNTIRQAIQALQSDNLVETVPRVGCVVAEAAQTYRKVGVAVVGPVNPSYMFGLEALHGEFARMGCDVALHFVPQVTDETLGALIQWSRRQGGILLIGWVPVRLLQAMSRERIRVVLCGEPMDGPCPPEASAVTVSTENIVSLALSHLVGLGHRRIRLCAISSGSRYYDMLVNSFNTCCAEYHIEGSVQFFERGKEDMGPPLLEWLEGQKTPPTALLVENARQATKTIELLSANGWPVPERISVMATALAIHEAGIMEDLTCVLVETREMFLRAVQILLSLIESYDPHAQREVSVAKYIPGKTCRAYP